MKQYLFLLIILSVLPAIVPAQTTMEGGLIYDDYWQSTPYDYVIPNADVYCSLEISLLGADGGTARVGRLFADDCTENGGSGAEVTASFDVGQGAGELKPGGKIRALPGKAGTNIITILASSAGTNGGASSAILYTEKANDPAYDALTEDLSLAGSHWVILAVAGGGGGAYQGIFLNQCVDNNNGQGGRASTSGGDGRGDDYEGGTDGQGGTSAPALTGAHIGGGGGVYSDGSDAPHGGQKGNADLTFFTWNAGGGQSYEYSGFTTGGLVDLQCPGGGGGGGYSGGGGGTLYFGGGGGGSFVNPAASSAVKTNGADGGSTGNFNGFYSLQLTADDEIPTYTWFRASGVVLQLDATTGTYVPTIDDFFDNVSDNCSPADSVVMTTVPAIFTCDEVGVRTITVDITDLAGNTRSHVATVEVRDDNYPYCCAAPTVACSDVTIQPDASGTVAGADIISQALSYTADCGVDNIALSHDFLDCDDLGTTAVELTLTDGSGRLQHCTADITIDATPPTAACNSTTLNVSVGQTVTIADLVNLTSAYSGGCGATTGSYSPTTLDCTNLGTNTYIYTRTDAGGATFSCTSTITLQLDGDCLDDATYEYSGQGTETINAADLLPDDGCASSTVTGSSLAIDCSDFTNEYAVLLDNSNAGVIFNHHDAIDFDYDDEFTVGFWFKPSANQTATVGDFWTIVGKTESSTTQYPFVIGMFDDYTIGMKRQNADGQSHTARGGSDPLTPGQWHYVTAQKTSTSVQIHIDGDKVHGGLDPLRNYTATMANEGTIKVGTMHGFTNQYAVGEIDDLRVWNDNMSLIQVRESMDRGYRGDEAELVLYATFDEGPNAIRVTDFTANDAGSLYVFETFTSTDLVDIPKEVIRREVTIDGVLAGGESCVSEVTIRRSADNDCEALLAGGPRVAATVMLGGAYNFGSGLMNTHLATAGLLPTTESYTALGYTHVDGGGETTTAAVLAATGNDAVVDWVMLELRYSEVISQVAATRSALLLADGRIVDVDGVSPVAFPTNAEGPRYLIVRHRSHLSVMTDNVLSLAAGADASFDFSDPTAAVYSSGSAAQLANGSSMTMIAGDANRDGEVNAVDINAAWQPQNGQAYSYPGSSADVNLDGTVNAVDYNLILLINNSLVEQLPAN